MHLLCKRAGQPQEIFPGRQIQLEPDEFAGILRPIAVAVLLVGVSNKQIPPYKEYGVPLTKYSWLPFSITTISRVL